MTTGQLRDEMASSLGMISKHVKYIRRYKRSRKQRREFLEAFERNFLDHIHTIVSARNVKTKEESALRHIKIVHYNSARLCLEDVIRRLTPAWRRFKGNRELFINVSLSDAIFNQFVKQWNEAGDVVTKTKYYRDDDKIKDPGKFDNSIDALIEMEPHINETLTKCRLNRWWRVIISCLKSLWIWFVLPAAVLIFAAFATARLDFGKKDSKSVDQESASVKNCNSAVSITSNNNQKVQHNTGSIGK